MRLLSRYRTNARIKNRVWTSIKSRVFGLVPIDLRMRALSPTEVEGMAKRKKMRICTLSERLRRMYSSYISNNKQRSGLIKDSLETGQIMGHWMQIYYQRLL